jgi:hypothetical protein
VFASPVRFTRVSESSICLDAKETKNIHGLLMFFGMHESSISRLKIQNLKTTSKLCSADRVVRSSSSTHGLLSLYFFAVFYLRAEGGVV